MNNEYSVSTYGDEIGIFSATSRCFVLFCATLEEAERRCKELNDLHNAERNQPRPTGITAERYGDENFLFDNDSNQIITHF